MVKRTYSHAFSCDDSILSNSFIDCDLSTESQEYPEKRRKLNFNSDTDYIEVPELSPKFSSSQVDIDTPSSEISFKSQESSFSDNDSLFSSSFVNSEEEKINAIQTINHLKEKCEKQIKRFINCSKHLNIWISSEYRAEVYDWIIDFFNYYNKKNDNISYIGYTFSESTAQLAMEYLDRFFAKYELPRFPNQIMITMFTFSALILACKYNELDTINPTVKDLIDYTEENDISKSDILKCEELLLDNLSWELGDVVPHTLAENYYNMLQNYGVSCFTVECAWKKSILQTNEFLRYKYQNPKLISIPNSLFTCTCILFSRLVTLQELYSIENSKPIDIIEILGEDQVWPICWKDILGFDIQSMSSCLATMQDIYLRNKKNSEY